MNNAAAAASPLAGACPLCSGREGVRLDVVTVADLDAEYRRQLGVEAQAEFPAEVKEVCLVQCARCGLQFFDPLVAGSADFYAALSRSPAYYSTTRWEFTKAREFIGPKARVLDVGCGDGYFLSLLPQPTKLGLELNPEAVVKARQRGVDVRQGGLESMPDASADALSLFQVLEHLPAPRQLLAEAVRVLAPGGVLLVAVPDNDGFVGRAIFEPLNLPPHHPLRWTRAALCFLPSLFPLTLTTLESEPLAPEHVFIYRRTRLTDRVARWRGGRLPLLKRSPGLVWLRRLCNLLTMASMRWSTAPPRQGVSGHSVLAVYRRRAA